jgi:hypothetical protein
MKLSPIKSSAMRKQGLVLIIASVALATVIVSIMGCKKEDDGGPPMVNTVAVTDVSFSSADCEGSVIDSNGYSLTARGFVIDTIPNPKLGSNLGFTEESNGIGEFVHTLTSLESGTKYFIKAYATNSKGTAYGIELDFTTAVVSFANYIHPVFTDRNCIACHKTGYTTPDLSIENAYNSIVPELVNLSDPRASKIYSVPSPASSHPARYSQFQAALVLKWIEAGAMNN